MSVTLFRAPLWNLLICARSVCQSLNSVTSESLTWRAPGPAVMAAERDWWLDRNGLQPRNVGYIGAKSRETGIIDSPRGAPIAADYGGDEIFLGSRRAQGQMFPEQARNAPFGMDNAMDTPRQRVVIPQPVVDQDHWLAKSGMFSPFKKPSQSGKDHGKNSSWRASDPLPLALDCSPRQPRQMPVSRLARDPVLTGYASQGTGGYGSEMLFGQESPRQAPDLDLQTARWRLTGDTNDPHPFTLNGSVPAPSPRRDPRRQVQREIMASFGKDDTLGNEQVRREMARHAGTGADNEAQDVAFFFGSPRPAKPDPVTTGRGDWRVGDPNAFTMDGSHASHPKVSPYVDSSWRTYAKDGVGIAMSQQPAPPRDLTPRAMAETRRHSGYGRLPMGGMPQQQRQFGVGAQVPQLPLSSKRELLPPLLGGA